jgi:hypothetical protein
MEYFRAATTADYPTFIPKRPAALGFHETDGGPNIYICKMGMGRRRRSAPNNNNNNKQHCIDFRIGAKAAESYTNQANSLAFVSFQVCSGLGRLFQHHPNDGVCLPFALSSRYNIVEYLMAHVW